MSSSTQLAIFDYYTRFSSLNQSDDEQLSIIPNQEKNGQLYMVNQKPLSTIQYKPKIQKTFSLSNLSENSNSMNMSRNKLKHLKQVYCTNLSLFQSLALIAFFLILSRLYDVNKDINYLRHVSSVWLPNITIPNLKYYSESYKRNSITLLDENKNTPSASLLTTTTFDMHNQNEKLIDNLVKELNNDSISDNSELLPQPQALETNFNKSSTLINKNENFPSSSLFSDSETLTTPLSTQVESIQKEIDFIKAKSAYFHIENLRKDVDSLIVEMWSSRTTLILSLVFIVVYIISWAWMAHAVREIRHPKDVTLKTVLLLAIFSAVDIAASAGFIMVRLILYSMKDSQFASEMRIPSPFNEYQQLTAFTALRFSALRSTSSSIDVFTSSIISLFVFIRIYSVISAIKFYSKVKKSFSQDYKHRNIATLNDASSDRTSKDYDEFFKRISFVSKDAASLPISPITHSHFINNGPTNSSTLLKANIINPALNNLNDAINNAINQTTAKNLLNNSAISLTANNLNRNKNDISRFSTATSNLSDEDRIQQSILNTLSSNDHVNINLANNSLQQALNLNLPFHNLESIKNIEDQQNNSTQIKINSNTSGLSSMQQSSNENQIKIQAADMPMHMQKMALQSANTAIQLYSTEKHIAESIKQDFDNEFEPTWHCIVGKNWGSCVTHSKQCYIRMNFKELTILLYKST